MTPLAQFGREWSAFVDHLADTQVDLLRRMAERMDEDQQARSEVEGSRDWRDLAAKRGNHGA